jgi:hypothetical protein
MEIDTPISRMGIRGEIYSAISQGVKYETPHNEREAEFDIQTLR